MNAPPTHAGRSSAEEPRAEVAEFQGLYGSYHVSETLLQKVWLRGEFDQARARLTTGERLRVVHRGTWNRLGGPDFQEAELAIDDRVVTGDIEVHFRPASWFQHRHERDPAYDRVALHVALFPPGPGERPAVTSSGRVVPLLVLVDLLWHDLEEYAADEAVAALSGSDPWPLVEDLLGREPSERNELLAAAAARRWREKVHFARVRIEKLGWEEACHLTALEILGYRHNRAALMRVGTEFTWASWRAAPPSLEELATSAATGWTLRGVRPANHPRLRLEQYREWMRCAPDWPARLRDWPLPTAETAVSEADPATVTEQRRRLGLAGLRKKIARQLCGGAIAGTRLDTWICNQMLPFRAKAGEDGAAMIRWMAWYCGDFSDGLIRAARQILPAGQGGVRSNGLMQGLLGMQLARAARGEAVGPR